METGHQVQLDFVEFLKFEKRFSSHTVRGYSDDLAQFIEYLSIQFDTEVCDAQPAQIRSWLVTLKADEMASKTLRRKISALRSFYKYCLRIGKIKQSPMRSISSPRLGKKLPVYVEKKEVDILFNDVEFPDTFRGKTDYLVLLILYHTGVRVSELVNLRVNQINLSSKSIRVMGKGGKERVIPISDLLADEIQRYLSEKRKQRIDGGVTLLVTEKGKSLYSKYVYLVVKKYLQLVTTHDKKSPHVMRHTFATHLANNGADLNAIKELLGHASLAATQVYTHTTIEKLKQVHKSAHPKA